MPSNVSDLSDRWIMADLSQARSLEFEHAREANGDSPHGGISGSPCFLVQEDRQAKLVAFATSEAMGIIRFTRVRWLNLDGTLKK